MGNLLFRIWGNSFFKKVFHAVCPRIRVSREYFGIKMYMNINDHLQYYLFPKTSVEPESERVMSRHWGAVWDIGANYGMYSLLAAKSGNQVYAFDLSHRALSLLEKSARRNQLPVTIVRQAVTVTKTSYTPPSSSDCTNELQAGEGRNVVQSLTWLEVAKEFGIPDLIKMDIEGGEIEFFESKQFRSWLNKHKVSMLVELHKGYQPDLSFVKGGQVEHVDKRFFFIDYRRR